MEFQPAHEGLCSGGANLNPQPETIGHLLFALQTYRSYL